MRCKRVCWPIFDDNLKTTMFQSSVHILWVTRFLAFWEQILLFWYRDLLFGRPGASAFASWRTLDDRGAHGAQRRTLWVRLPILKALRVLWTRIVAMLISMFPFLISLGSESGFLRVEKQTFGIRSIAKNIFRRSWICYDSRVEFA